MQKISIKDIENSMLYPNYIKINDFLYEICSFHRFFRCILIEILGISWKIHKLTWTFENFREFWNNLENFRSEIFQILTKKNRKNSKFQMLWCCVHHVSHTVPLFRNLIPNTTIIIADLQTSVHYHLRIKINYFHMFKSRRSRPPEVRCPLSKESPG